MYYGDKKASLVNLSYALSARGWKIYGYKEDMSDMMTDYYDPASWSGIAVKNGFILAVDAYSGGTIGGDIIRESYDPKIAKRIRKLQALADDKAAAKGERENALAMIEKLDKDLVKTVIETSDLPPVEYQKNPGNSKWHIEKDGKIIAKGTGVFQFSRVNTWRDEYVVYDDFEVAKHLNATYFNMTDKEDWEKNNAYRKEEKAEKTKLLDKFFALIEKWDNIVRIKIGDGDEEGLVKKTVVKTTTYYVAKISKTPTSYVAVGDGWRRACGLEKNIIYKLSDDKQHVKKLTKNWTSFDDGDFNTYKPEPRKSAKPQYFSGSEEDWKKGHYKYIELVEKVKTHEEEIWVKKPAKKTKKASSPKKQTENKNKDFNSLIEEGEIVDFERTDGKGVEKVLRIKAEIEDFRSFNQYMKSNKMGYYSRFAKGFILYEEYAKELLGKLSGDSKKAASVAAALYSADLLQNFANGTLF